MQGLQVWDSNGVITLDTNTQNTKFIVETQEERRTIYNDLFITNTPFYIVIPTAFNEISRSIKVSFNGNKCEIINNSSHEYSVMVGVY